MNENNGKRAPNPMGQEPLLNQYYTSSAQAEKYKVILLSSLKM